MAKSRSNPLAELLASVVLAWAAKDTKEKKINVNKIFITKLLLLLMVT